MSKPKKLLEVLKEDSKMLDFILKQGLTWSECRAVDGCAQIEILKFARNRDDIRKLMEEKDANDSQGS
jgi:hypothetical protein